MNNEITLKFKFDYFRLWPFKAVVYWYSIESGRRSFYIAFVWKGEIKSFKLL